MPDRPKQIPDPETEMSRAKKGLRIFGSVALVVTPVIIAVSVAVNYLVPQNNPILEASSTWTYILYGLVAIALIGYSIGLSAFTREACPDPTGHFIGNITLLAIPLSIVMYGAGTFLPSYGLRVMYIQVYPPPSTQLETYLIVTGFIIAQTALVGAAMIIASTLLGTGYRITRRTTFAGRKLGTAALFMGAFVFSLELLQLATFDLGNFLTVGLYGLLVMSVWNFPAGIMLYRKD